MAQKTKHKIKFDDLNACGFLPFITFANVRLV